MECYSCAIRVPQAHIIDLPGGRLQYGGVSMHDWPGVSSYGLEPKPLDPEQRAKYLEHFVGEIDGGAGERVVQLAEGT